MALRWRIIAIQKHKGIQYDGSLTRPESTVYGAVYHLREVLKHENDAIKGKRVTISGYGNGGWGIMKKTAELRAKDPVRCKPYAEEYGAAFVHGEKCWGVNDVDI